MKKNGTTILELIEYGLSDKKIRRYNGGATRVKIYSRNVDFGEENKCGVFCEFDFFGSIDIMMQTRLEEIQNVKSLLHCAIIACHKKELELMKAEVKGQP